MAIEQIIDVPANGKLLIEIPGSQKNKTKLKIIINELDDTLESKIALLRNAIRDPDFLADMEEVNMDFEFIDSKIE